MIQHKQTGSVLATSLVLLTAITMLSIMGIQRSGLQTKIVANQQHKETAFHAAYSLLEDAYATFQTSNTQMLSDAMDHRENYNYQMSLNNNSDNTIHPETAFNFNTPLNNHITASTKLTYKSNDNDPGNPNTSGLRQNFSRGKNGTGIAKFEVESLATLPNGIFSNQLLGFHLITPEQ